ncbi:AAA family ATPase [Adlercreutzia sp. R21]|uniref:ATP-binding protein n=1 Tax=Adlercreutzia wanghongyangiae TaxID=3111451 RepID=UPI002DBA09BD|nr:AAA family ATPase [Adlercreutzia sp. R21]MEC4183549.1 AAA family ATPase [Adlercreutzia sp. R21]
MFKRKAYESLIRWKAVSQGATAALIEGARRIGKSTVAERFAQSEYNDYLLLDFSTEGENVRRLFREDIGNLDSFFRKLFLLKGHSLEPRCSVIIFDEVQLFPLARQSIKALVKDGRYDYIETGSLISIKKNTKDILIPSEEHKIKMYPMDFEEFLWAKGDDITAPAIRDAFAARRSLGEDVHRRIMADFRSYLAVGGMPQAVEAFVEGCSFEEIDFVKRTILSLYEEDLHKYNEEGFNRVSAIFRSIPEQLSRHNAQFKFSVVEKAARFKTVAPSIDFLGESMMVNLCYNVTAPDVLLELHADRSNFKMFMGDTGLLVTQVSRSGPATDDSLYKALIFDKLGTNQGMIMENMVAQMLVASGHDLYFHEFKFRPEGSKEEKPYEVDFLLVRGKRLCPVEVKSSGYKAHKSLDYFFGKYHVKANERYVLSPKDLSRKENTVYLPLYMAMCL